MKRKFLAACLLFSVLLTLSCSKDDDPSSKFKHVGEKWIITSVTFNIINQKFNPPAQSFKNGTEENAGAFYFDGSNGSFDIQIPDNHKEDYFTWSEDGNGGVTIQSVSQSVGGSGVSQFTITLSGDKTSDTSMTLDGQITKQTSTEQFVMTGTFTLTKE